MRIFKIFALISTMVVILSVSAFAAAPVILAQPQSIYVPQGTSGSFTASFSVLASGEDLSYQWQRSTDYGNSWSDLTSVSSANAPTLTVNTTILNGRYMYRCVVSSNDSSVISDTVTVSVGVFTLGTLRQFLQWLTECSYSIFDWVGSCCGQIVEQPLLLFTVGFLALGGSIAIVSRLLSRS